MLGSLGGFVDNTLGTSIFGRNANDLAYDQQSQGTVNANNTLANEYLVQRGYLTPTAQIGNTALSQLAGNNFMENWQQDPGYQFQLQQGQNAINAGAAARGMGNSGATMKALAGYSQNLASQEYDKVYNRENSRLNQLAGYGQNATNGLVNSSQNYGNQVSANYMGLGNAGAASEIGKGNQQANALQQGASFAAMAFSDKRLKKNISEVPTDEIDEMKKSLKAFYYEYKDVLHGAPGRHIGIMAQDLEKSKLGKEIVVETSEGKAIDLGKVLSIFLATMAEVA